MVTVNTGVHRVVFLVGKYAIKVPRMNYGWLKFLEGICRNIIEKERYRYSDFKYLLCPVVWASWGGWILVMRRADVKKHQDEIRALPDESDKSFYKEWIEVGYDEDLKCDNFGYLDGRLVKVDY